MITVELPFPYIIEENGGIAGYGGNQDWFPQEWQRKAGCGATNGANMAAYYGLQVSGMEALYEGSRQPVKKAEYLALMEEMYRRMTPGVMGYPYPVKLGKRFAEYAAERGVKLTPAVHCHWENWQEGFAIVRQAIDAGRPVGLLILVHRAEELQEDIWHWVTVTGYTLPEKEEEKPMVILSDCGDRDLYRADVLLEVHRKNLVRMVEFEAPAAGEDA